MSSIVDFLKEELEKRKEKNGSYSLRSFALSLEENPSYLYKILQGDIQITAKKVYKYGLKLKIDKAQMCDYIIYELDQAFQSSSKSSEKNDV